MRRGASSITIAIATVSMVCASAGADAPAERRIAAELGRLVGHRVEVAADRTSYVIRDVAGEGAPHVGVVERRGRDLFLIEDGRTTRLTGPLAIPRIAGPGYKVWVLGAVAPDGSLVARRLGVLSPPAKTR